MEYMLNNVSVLFFLFFEQFKNNQTILKTSTSHNLENH